MKLLWITQDRTRALVYTGMSATVELGNDQVEDILNGLTDGEYIVTFVPDDEFDTVLFQIRKRKDYIFIDREAVVTMVSYLENSFDDLSSDKDFYNAYQALRKSYTAKE